MIRGIKLMSGTRNRGTKHITQTKLQNSGISSNNLKWKPQDRQTEARSIKKKTSDIEQILPC